MSTPAPDPLWGPFTDRRSRSTYLWDCFWRHADHVRELMPELKPRQWERIRRVALRCVVDHIETDEPTIGLKETEADCERALFFALQFKDKTCDCEELNCGCEPVTDGELARLDVVDAVEFAILEHHQDILEDDLLRDARIVDGRRRVSYGSWQWVLKKTVRIVIETCRKVLELNANDPDVDVLRLRLAEKAPWQLTETWRSITHDSRLGLPDSGDIDLEPGPLGVDEHVDAEARTIAKDILAILPAQGGPFNVWEYLNAEIDREQAELDKANAAANALVEKISSMAGTSPEPQPVREEAGEPGTDQAVIARDAIHGLLKLAGDSPAAAPMPEEASEAEPAREANGESTAGTCSRARWTEREDTFIERIWRESESGERIKREDISLVAGYEETSRKNLGTPKQTTAAVDAFNGVFSLATGEFIRRLAAKKKSSPKFS